MSEHTPIPWVEVGSHDFRGANMALVGMVNPTVKQGKVDRAFIVKACNAHDALVTALRRITSLEEKNVTKYAQDIAREALAKVQS